MNPICVYGAGAFGTALAISLARAGQSVCLIARNKDHVAALARDRVNKSRLPGIGFPETLEPALEAPAKSRVHLMAVPTNSLCDLVMKHNNALSGGYVVACCKGLDLETGLGPTGIIKWACPDAVPAILSGPSFAVDIGAGLPTALTLAVSTDDAGVYLQKNLHFSSIRLYRSMDVLGVELGGALKNVIALASGVTMGAGLGESARAALITRGYHEMQRFAAAKGALPETLLGLSGFGDLILTCTSEKSRNFCHGYALGKGETPDLTKTVEGTRTAAAVCKAASADGIDMPITATVSALLAGEMTINDSIAALLARPLKKE